MQQLSSFTPVSRYGQNDFRLKFERYNYVSVKQQQTTTISGIIDIPVYGAPLMRTYKRCMQIAFANRAREIDSGKLARVFEKNRKTFAIYQKIIFFTKFQKTA